MCLCGAKWGVSPGIRGGFAGRYAAVGRILKRAGWARLALTAAWNTYAHVLGAGLNLGTRLRLDLKDAGEPGRSPAVYLVTEHV